MNGVCGTALRAVEVGDASRGVIHKKVVSHGIDLGRVAWREGYALVSLRHDVLKAGAVALRKTTLHPLERYDSHNSQSRQLLAQSQCHLRSCDVETDSHTAQKVAVTLGIQPSDGSRQLLVARAIVGAMTCKTSGYVFFVGDNYLFFCVSKYLQDLNIVFIAVFRPRHTASHSYPTLTLVASRGVVAVLRLGYDSDRICSCEYLW